MSKITVIIPIYNTEEFLPDCINSVINQTYKNLEIILINDGSDDTSKELIQQFAEKDNRIKHHHFTTRKGVGYARNYGIKISTGDYIYFIDSDDYMADQALELLIENIGDSEMIIGKIRNTTKGVQADDQNTEDLPEPVISSSEKIKRKGFQNLTVLHRLISRKFIEDHRLHFSKEVECFSDLTFIIPAMINIEHIRYLKSSIYYKRRRNDPILNPSLMQMNKEKVISDFIYLYSELKQEYRDSLQAEIFLDYHFLNFYRKTIILFFANEENIDILFDKLKVAARLMSNQRLRKTNPIVKYEFKFLKQNKPKKFKKLISTHLTLGNLKQAFHSRRMYYLALYRQAFIKMPVKENMIVFESFLGKNYSDSPKYIYEYMVNQNMDFKYIWIFTDKNKKIPGNAKVVKRFSLSYYYYLARAKYWVSNSRLPKHLNKRKENIYLQTWHGTPLKKLVFDMRDIYSANPNYKRDFYIQSRRWDYLIAANQYSSDIFKRAFLFDKEMLEFGYPRNDILHQENHEEAALNLKKKLGIPIDKKVVLYAPTWRDNDYFDVGQYRFNLKLDLEKMRNELGDEYVILLRMHYFIANSLDVSNYEGFVFDYSKYDDIAELYLISDILITDYSSVFFDYANLKRPILFFTYDLEEYRDTLRGFYIDIENEVPGPLVMTTDEVISSIKNIDQVMDQYKEKYDAFYEKFCGWEKGNATEKVVETVFLQNSKS